MPAVAGDEWRRLGSANGGKPGTGKEMKQAYTGHFEADLILPILLLEKSSKDMFGEIKPVMCDSPPHTLWNGELSNSEHNRLGLQSLSHSEELLTGMMDWWEYERLYYSAL